VVKTELSARNLPELQPIRPRKVPRNAYQRGPFQAPKTAATEPDVQLQNNSITNINAVETRSRGKRKLQKEDPGANTDHQNRMDQQDQLQHSPPPKKRRKRRKTKGNHPPTQQHPHNQIVQAQGNPPGPSTQQHHQSHEQRQEEEAEHQPEAEGIADPQQMEEEPPQPQHQQRGSRPPLRDELAQELVQPDQPAADTDTISFPQNAKLMSKGLLTVQEFIQAQQEDEALTDCHQKANSKKNSKFSYMRGVLCHHKGNGMNRKPVLPAELFKQYLFSSHYNITSGHRSANQIAGKIQDVFHVQDLEKKVKNFEGTCFYCQIFRTRRKRVVPYLPSQMATEPRQIWSVDYAFGFVTAEDKATILTPEEDGDKEEKNQKTKAKRTTKNPDIYTGVLIFLDNASSFTVILPIKTKKSSEFLEMFEKHIINSYCTPKVLRSDRETGLRSKEVQNYLDNLGIEHQPTAASSAWSNGQIENHVSKIKQLIATAYHQDAKQTWTTHLPLIATAHNRCPLMYTKTAQGVLTPEKLFFGNSVAENFQPVVYTDNKGTTAEDYSNYLDTTVKELRQAATKRMREHRARKRQSENKKTKAKHFAVNDVVWLKNIEIGKQRTLKQRYTGPYVITSVRFTTAGLKNLHTNEERKAHFRHIENVENVPDTLVNPSVFEQLAKTLMKPD
jgi:hypothetical protein